MSMYRMTISVPAELKARMDAADKGVGVVWSRVAVSALEERVRQIETVNRAQQQVRSEMEKRLKGH